MQGAGKSILPSWSSKKVAQPGKTSVELGCMEVESESDFLTIIQSVTPTKLLSWAVWSEIHHGMEVAHLRISSNRCRKYKYVMSTDVVCICSPPFLQPILKTSFWGKQFPLTNWLKRKEIWPDSQMGQHKMLALKGNELLPHGLEGVMDSSKSKSFWGRANHPSCIVGEEKIQTDFWQNGLTDSPVVWKE